MKYVAKNYLLSAVVFLFLGFVAPSPVWAVGNNFPDVPCGSTGTVLMTETPTVPVTICGVTYNHVFVTNSTQTSGSPAHPNYNFHFFNEGDFNTITYLDITSGSWTGYRGLKFSQTAGAFIYCSNAISPPLDCFSNVAYVPDRGSASYTTTFRPIIHSSYDFGGLVTPDITPTPSYSLEVTSPTLTDSHAEVAPSDGFLVAFSYTLPVDADLADYRFSVLSCTQADCESDLGSENFTLGTGLLSEIFDETDIEGYAYMRVPSLLGVPSYYVATLTSPDVSEHYDFVLFSLTGSYAPGLPMPDDAFYPDDVEVPNPVTDPTGFVSALFTNATNWIVKIIVPSFSYFQGQFNTLKNTIDTKFAFYGQLKDAFTVPEASSFTPLTLGSLHIGGTTMAPITFISSFNPDDFASFRNFLSMILYVGLGFFVIRKVSNIFSA